MRDLMGTIERLYVHCARLASSVQIRDREWRTKRRAGDPRPLSDRVVYPRRVVDVVAAKKGRPGK